MNLYMQNRYAGDVGDFGKIGMLRSIENTGIKIGVNWYLVEDEDHNADGKHTGYLNKKQFLDIDDELRKELAFLVSNNNRSVFQLEKLKLLQSDVYYHELLKASKGSIHEDRHCWHQNALSNMKDCELVFLDPDNGLIPKSVGYGSTKSIKYVLPEEIIDYYEAGHSVVFYNHRTREQLEDYLHRFDELFNSKELEQATIVGITFRRGTVRDYFLIIQEEHAERVVKGIQILLDSKWNLHFESIKNLEDIRR